MTECLEDKIVEVCQRDSRYRRNAYLFVLDALDLTIQRISRSGRNRHVGGRDLLVSIRDLGAQRFGPMAKTVFNQWGVVATEDFGQMVFNLIDVGLLQRRQQDTIHDFADGYDFERVFVQDYRARVPWGELTK
ncbi:MAG: hypothetical protein CMJ85_09185 [Planctomycetes bacterium]|jgi:uncharacterized repeat protein (TIGR04138 family)|nr:hypothetical protein [Planctomycetota bacterium]MDP6423913.1 hypothetical protein [Planctomycetota bacterium]